MASGDQIDAWIGRLRLIPDSARQFAVAREQAEREFGFDADALGELVARGLPCAQDGDGPLLWATDLQYLSLRLDRGAVYQGVLNRWASALASFSARAQTPVAIRCRAYAPAGTTVELLAPGGERVRAQAGAGGAPLGFEATMRGELPPLPAPLARTLGEVLADLAAHDFCWLRPPLEADLAFVRATRLANCRSTAGLLVEEAPRLGVEARLVHGLLLAPPYSTPHNWAEVRTDDGWVALDPLLLGLLARFAGLDAAAWPPERSPGAILLGLTEPGTPLVRDAASGAPLEATFLTRPLVEPEDR
ncbi:MAG: transglutaminase domain-containing protein [Actinobacteria bacterium]|nr:transglutaminase domain-containing protein [Actinomycetota bacterium]